MKFCKCTVLYCYFEKLISKAIYSCDRSAIKDLHSFFYSRICIRHLLLQCQLEILAINTETDKKSSHVSFLSR